MHWISNEMNWHSNRLAMKWLSFASIVPCLSPVGANPSTLTLASHRSIPSHGTVPIANDHPSIPICSIPICGNSSNFLFFLSIHPLTLESPLIHSHFDYHPYLRYTSFQYSILISTNLAMPKQITEVKEFMSIVSSADCHAVLYKANESSHNYKFKARTPSALYTLVINDAERAKKVKASIGGKLQEVN